MNQVSNKKRKNPGFVAQLEEPQANKEEQYRNESAFLLAWLSLRPIRYNHTLLRFLVELYADICDCNWGTLMDYHSSGLNCLLQLGFEMGPFISFLLVLNGNSIIKPD